MTIATIPETHADILTTARQAFMSTRRVSDGFISTTPVGFDWDGAFIRISTLKSRVKYRNLVADPRLTVCIIDPLAPTRYIEIRGVAELIDDPDGSFNKAIYRKRTGKEFDLDMPGAERVIVKVIPLRVSTPTLYGGRLDRPPGRGN